MKKTIIISAGVIILFASIIAIWAVNVSNSEIKLKNRGEAQQEVCNAYFDKMWKILQQKAGVTEQYKDAFKDIYPKLIEGRYANDGKSGSQTFMKWITESNPHFDISLYKDLMVSIEAERNGLFMEYSKLLDINRQHITMRQTWPNSIVIGNRKNIGYEEDENGKVIKKGIVIIKSTKTEEAVNSGKDDNIDLFKK